ncbi:MAG: helix-turn-helix domain-containing protein [Stellaceae bacterium]
MLREAADRIEKLEADAAASGNPAPLARADRRYRSGLDESQRALAYMENAAAVILRVEKHEAGDWWRNGSYATAVALRKRIARMARARGFSLTAIAHALGYHHTTILSYLERRTRG